MDELVNLLFSSYIKGGTTWPQINAGINLYILNTLAETASAAPVDWVALSQAGISERQVSNLTAIMQGLHEKHGIKLHKPVDLQGEWLSGKACVFRSVLHYIHGQNPCLSASKRTLLTPENGKLINSFTANHPEQMRTFYSMSTGAKRELTGRADLSRLFVSCISRKPLDLEKADKVCYKYGLDFDPATPLSLAVQIMGNIRTTIHGYLQENYQGYCFEAVDWGFDLPSYLIINK